MDTTRQAETTQVGQMTFSRPNDTQLVADRDMDAQRDLVWAAHTQCEHVKNWLTGPEGWIMPVCEIDLRPGGMYRYVYEGPGAPSFSMSGQYQDVAAPERVVNTESMDDGPVATLNTLTLTEQDGHTHVHTIVEYPSKEVREEIIATGMLDGWAESYDKLEDYLRMMRKG